CSAYVDGAPVPGASKNIQKTWPVLGSHCRLYRRKENKSHHDLLQKQEAQMKHLTAIGLILNLAIASVSAQHSAANAQQAPVKMTFSGTAAASTIDLKQPNTTTAEEDLAGNGTLGSFTFRMVKASANAPQPSSTCSGLYFPNVAGGGLFRFKDGS